MIEVISRQNPRKRTECEHCNSILEYDASDENYVRENYDYVAKVRIRSRYITCPVCNYRCKVGTTYYDDL